MSYSAFSASRSCRRSMAAFLALALFAGPSSLRAGSTGNTPGTTGAGLFMPQGEGAGRQNGDYITSLAANGGLDTVYRYFIEVPPSLSRLVVDLFDADIGVGTTTEANSGRDRQRETTNGNGWNTTATYTLVNPSGAARNTLFTTGDSANPALADNLWLSLLDSTGDNVRDNFGTVAYTNNDGLLSWAGNWIETNDDAAANAGQILITGGELRIGDNGSPFSVIEREANLSGAGFTTATFSFGFRTTGVDAGDVMQVQVSANGGGAWTNLETFTGPFAASTRSYNITTSIATNTRIRFLAGAGYGNNDFFFVDNLQIQETNIDAGHWELRVDMSSGAANDDDINAIGIRAHDGNSGATGTELNVYYDSQSQFGVNPSGSGTGANSRTYAFFPYLTSGCSASSNDFDFDAASTSNTSSLSFTRRGGGFTQNVATGSLSGDNAWMPNSFTGWTSDTLSIGYGLWTGGMTITTYFTGGGAVINGNYANLWLGNFNVASATPAANPTANAFRVYLPNDAGTAPAEPYVEQQATFSGCGLSGPNPPVVGQTSCFTVTVKVVNPAAQAITFSASNLVTANIPGSGAVYGGTPQVSQGSIVSQPSIGGTGNITWNPGTVAAGATALLAYRVRVTPTSAGQRVPLTATPASGNGTRAQFVDTTGNTTQTRATYLFGPLCELAVSENLLTQAVVASFHASPAAGGGVLLEWQTASEAGTAGFYVERWDAGSRRWLRVNKQLLAGLLHAPQGGTYRFVDDGASPGESQTYRLVEVEAAGRRQTYGPFRAEMDWQRPDPRRDDRLFEREAHAASRSAAEALGEPEAAALKGLNLSKAQASPEGLHLSVKESGLYYLKAADVATWFGLAADKAAKMISEGKLSLSRNNQAVAWYPDVPAGTRDRDKNAQGLFFYGEAPDSLFTDASVYRLQRDKGGIIMPVVPAGTPTPAAGGTFAEMLHVERDLFAATVIAPDPDSDYWFWEFLQGGDASFGHRTFTLDAPGRTSTAGGSLTVTFQGATASGVADEHHAAVSLNGTALGETHWTGIAPKQATFAIPPGSLLAAGNQVVVTATTGAGAPFSFYYVDGFDLSYTRTLRAAGDTLAFTPGGSPQVTVGGFSSSTVRLLDVQTPLQPRWIAGAAVSPDTPSGFRLAFTPASQGRFLATTAVKTPAAVRAWSAPGLSSSANRAEYLVIAPAGLRDAAERLANLRRAQGLEALVVDLDQIMDELNAGSPSPHAIRSFLAKAFNTWSKPPRYVALAGEGTLDYRNLLSFGDNLVPPLMVQSEGGLFPSDNLLGDVNGDGLPEMAVGRIPVLSAAELDAYTTKIAAYESSTTANWAAHTIMVADANDRGADFAGDSERIAGQIPSTFTLDRVYLSTTPFAAARAQLLGALNSGASFVNYMGHGALDRLSAGGLLTNSDVAGLGNGSRLPVLTAMTCTVNRFAVPGISALGELLVKSPSGGAAAVWGPSGLSTNDQARLLAERFYHSGAPERLGDRVLRAISEFRALGGDPALPRIYDLLGDPALRIPVPPPATPAAGSSGE